MPRASASRLLHAPIEDVWRALVDTADYGRWNPFIVRVDGAAEGVGSRFRLHVRWMDGKGGTTSGEVVTSFEPPAVGVDGVARAAFVYRYTDALSTFGLVRAERAQRLAQAPGEPVRYDTEEVFTGLFAAFVPIARVQAGFDAMADALPGAGGARLTS